MTQIHLARLRSDEPGETVDFPSVQALSESFDAHMAGSNSDDGAALLYLVYRAAEVLTATQARATDSEARAEKVASLTVEQLKLAEQRISAVDAEREEVESKLNEAISRMQEYEIALRDSEARHALADTKLKAAERRATEAEARANATRAALLRVEEAIRTHLLAGDHAIKLKAAA